MFKSIAMRTLGLVLFCALLSALSACSRAPWMIGRWQDEGGRILLDLSRDGLATATISQAISSEVALPTAVDGFKIDLGFRLLEYVAKEITPAQGVLATPSGQHGINVQYVPRAAGQAPWTKVLFTTDVHGNVTLFVPGEMEGFRVENGDALVPQALVGSAPVPIPGASLVLDIVDSQLTWQGTLYVDARYRQVSPSLVELYVPIGGEGTASDLILCEVQRSSDGLAVVGKSLGVPSGRYRKADASRAQDTRAAGRGQIVRDIQGVQIGNVEDDVFVNTGVTVGRYQNVAFRLPGTEVVLGMTLTEAQPSQVPTATIRRGADQRGETGAFARGIFEKGEHLGVILGQ